MLLRFGYVAIALDVPQGSPNKTVTVKVLEKIADPVGRLHRLRRILRENLETTLRVLRYNAKNQIHLYRFTSKTVPLATHPLTAGWDYIEEYRPQWEELGDYIRQTGLRVSAHPDHFTLLNSPQPEVLAASLQDLEYHARLFDAMRLPPGPQLVLHIGGLYKDKAAAMDRFIQQYTQLPATLGQRLMLENDDKSYHAADVLALCRKTGCPMILDVHHHACLPCDTPLAKLWPDIVATWQGNRPKIHISSPKSAKDFRSHADFVNAADLTKFLAIAKDCGQDIDIMVEAKQKDLALFRLVEDLARLPGITRVEPAALEL